MAGTLWPPNQVEDPETLTLGFPNYRDDVIDFHLPFDKGSFLDQTSIRYL